MTSTPIKVIVVMGVAGSGKSTVGLDLAEALHWRFADGDDFHSYSNIEKMTRGEPLTDADREGWLKTLADSIRQSIEQDRPTVVACSALKASYRKMLQNGDDLIRLVYLKGDYQLFMERLKNRKGHFMQSMMLESQFRDLEEPKDALVVNAAKSPRQLVADIRSGLKL